MQLTVSGHHVDLTDSLRDYVTSRLARLERHFDNLTQVQVVLTVSKQLRSAEGSVNVTGGQLFANAESDNMYAAIDALADKLDAQVRKHKEKMVDHHRAEGGLKHQDTLTNEE